MDKVIEKIKKLSLNMRKKALEMAFNVGNRGSHLGGGGSSMEIIAALYGGAMNIDAKNPFMKERDRFIPSKAHCVLAYYTALAYAGYFDVALLDTFELNESDFAGHPVMNFERGIEFSGGSLGMGLSQGVGLALAAKRCKSSSKIFVLLGDGECNEGAVWEAVMSASHFKLNNLIAVVDKNKLQYDGEVSRIMNIDPLDKKFESFGWNVINVADGHSAEQLYKAYIKAKEAVNAPTAVICNTVKGSGVSFMENRKEWHHSRITREQFDIAMAETIERGKNGL
jgi:transketolase